MARPYSVFSLEVSSLCVRRSDVRVLKSVRLGLAVAALT